ncbi:putative lipid-transfer protein DIR1 [Trifolium pratense]|uniref:putative lipid-transfer protein DIR1 n=1 Tax=Trifolium pratense TaxID=57577 RepID=UPI001E696832|nr:putative lipid-transfer protein DIR1 [Trifolium pratense]
MATRCLGFATLVLTASILILEISSQTECGGDISQIKTQCRGFVEKDGPKIPPSEPCCEAMKGLDVSCRCKYVTPGVEAKISIEKALYVAQTCQCQNIPTDKCGSYTIPHSAHSKA